MIKQIGLPLRGRPILLITRMITDRIGLHSILLPLLILVVPSCDSNIRFVYFRAKGARARVHFPATYFFYFVARFAQTPSLFFVNIMKEKDIITQKRPVT